MTKTENKKNDGMPKWVRLSLIGVVIILLALAFLVLTGIAGQHGQHIAHMFSMSGPIALHGTVS